MSTLKLTLAILKPDVVKVPFALREIRQRIISAGFYVVRTREFNLTRNEVEQFYAEHAGRFFHNRLTTFMNSGPIHTHILAHSDAIQLWRKIMGPTKTFRAQYEAPDTIRGTFGLTDTRNSSHGSDSTDSALKEINFFFPDFNVEQWYKQEEPSLRMGLCRMDENSFTHFVSQEPISSFR